MIQIELEVNETALKNARDYAAASHTTLEGLLSAYIRLNFKEPKQADSTLGLFADEPEIVDQVMQYIQQARHARTDSEETEFAKDAA